MAMTFDLSSEQLAKNLADEAFKAIEYKVREKLMERVKPLIDEAAREVAKGIRPIVIKMHRDIVSNDIQVALILDTVQEKVD